MRRRPALWLVAPGLAVAFTACGVSAPVDSAPAASSRADAIRGGVDDVDGGCPDVFMMRVRFDTGQQYVCSATLVTSRTLLTAAHCFDPAAAPAGNTTLTDVWVQNTSPAPASSSPLWLRIDPADTRMHPLWSASDRLSYDVAAAALPTPHAQRPSPMLTRALTAADVGAPLRVVGWGITSAGGTGAGTRREVDLPLRGLTVKHLQLGDQSAKGICNGDSGGPSFLTARDGVRRVAGVHSYDSSLACNGGLDTRVDLFVGFVQQFIRDKEGGPTCFEDGLCAAGCASPDADCVCQADATCNGACPNLLTDPDCPADCVANGVCATAACPRLDPDCRAELAACAQDAECQYRACAADPQRPGRYCTRPCTAGCPTGTACLLGTCLLPQLPTAARGEACVAGGTFCLGGTQCTAHLGEALRCLDTCAGNADCGVPGECIAAENGQRLCRPTAAAGAACTAATLCLGGTRCTGFTGEPLTCRATCSADAECAADGGVGGECIAAQAGQRLCRPLAEPGAACVPETRCGGGTVCTGRYGDFLTCQATCAGDGDCPARYTCEDAQRGFKVCAPVIETLPRLGVEGGPAAGCSAVPGGPLVLAVLAVALWRRRPRRASVVGLERLFGPRYATGA